MFRLIFGFIVVAVSFSAFGAGDASRGEGLVAVCGACHGPDGNSPAGAFPTLAGQNELYLLKQLNDIKSGAREVPTMIGQLDNMTGQNLEDIAAYYAGQSGKGGAADPALAEQGEIIYRAGIPRKGIAACTACHLPNGKGNDAAKFPALAGQWPEYTVAQLKAFRSGDRHNDGEGRMMRATAMDMSDDEMAAVASYVYGLR